MQTISFHEIPKDIHDDVETIYTIRFPRQGHTSDIAIIEAKRETYGQKPITKDEYQYFANGLYEFFREYHHIDKENETCLLLSLMALS
jgi:hypothetical protein